MPEILVLETDHGPRPRMNSTGPCLQRDRLFSRLREHPLVGLSRDEIQTHFRGMPIRYWERVTKAELIWGLETVHTWSARVDAAGAAAPVVVASSRHYPERGLSKIMICARDRIGLLAKIAAGFSALRVNVLRADVFTRSDGVALDVFDVADLEQSHLTGADRLQQLVFLLEGALSDPPRFASVWAGEFHKLLPHDRRSAPAIEFDNDYSAEHTVIRVRAKDRLGLLHDLLKALADCRLNIDEALVETEDEIASDSFYVTDLRGEKIVDAERLQHVRKALVEAVVS